MKIKSLLLIAGLIICLSPISSFACACCADAGQYSLGKNKLDSYVIGELEKINFAAPNIYATPGYPDDIKGINPLGAEFSVTGMLRNRVWKFGFKDENGKSGTLALPLPLMVEDFRVDIHDGAAGGGDPVLYKELRFDSRVQSGTGIFQKGIAPATKYFLVLQGRGNNCMNASDFTHWRLEIFGKKASYTFFGEIKTE